MLSLLIVVSLSPVRGPGPRASRLEAIGETWARRAKVAVLSMAGHEDAELTRRACERHNLTLWTLDDRDSDERGRYSQFRAMAFAIKRAAAFEWFFWANDHTFVVVERLTAFLRQERSDKAVYAGSRLYGPCCGVFNSGAAGFALNAVAMRALREQWNAFESMSVKERRTRTQKALSCDPAERRAHIATCLRLLLGAEPVDSTDETGAERFNVYGPVRLATGAVDDWYKNKKARLFDTPGDMGKKRSSAAGRPPPPPSDPGVSRELVTFHYVSAEEARLLDALIHGSVLEPPFEPARLRGLWPPASKLGGYAHPWPARDPAKARRVAALLDSVALRPTERV